MRYIMLFRWLCFFAFLPTVALLGQGISDIKEVNDFKLESLNLSGFESSTILLTPNANVAILGLKQKKLTYVLLDSQGKELRREERAADGLQEIHKACYSFDGHLLLGGRFDNPDGSRGLGVLYLDDEIQKVVYKVLGKTPQEEKITLLEQTTKGHFLLAFFQKGYSWTLQLTIERHSMVKKKAYSIVQSKPKRLKSFYINAYTKGENQEIALIGRRSNGKLMFCRITESGTLLANTKLLNYKTGFREGRAIIYHPARKEFIIAGTFQHKDKKVKNAFIATLGQDGEIKKTWTSSQKKRNVSLYNISLQADGSLLCIGSTSSSAKGNQTWMYKVDLDKAPFPIKPDKIYTNGRFSALFVYLTPKGHTFILTSFGQKRELEKSIYKKNATFQSPTKITLDSTVWIEEIKNDTLDATEFSYLKVFWRANSSAVSYLHLRLIYSERPFGVAPHHDLFIPLQPGEQSGNAAFPVNGQLYLDKGKIKGIIMAGVGNTKIKIPDLNTNFYPRPILKIKGISLFSKKNKTTIDLTEDSIFVERLDTLTATINLTNTGKVIAKDVHVSLKLPYNVLVVSELRQQVDSVSAGGAIVFSFDFMPHSYYEFQRLHLDFFANDSVSPQIYKGFKLFLPDVFAIQRSNGSFYTPKEVIDYRGNKGGPAAFNIIFSVPPVVIIKQITPKEEHTKETIPKIFVNHIVYEAEIFSTIELTKENIKLFRTEWRGDDKGNGAFQKTQLLNESNGFCVKVLESKENKEGYLYEFQTILPLIDRGESVKNSFLLEVIEKAGAKLATKNISIEYIAPIKRMWVYCIGIPSKDAPTVESATLIYNYFDLLKSDIKKTSYFDKSSIHLKLITSVDETTADEITNFFTKEFTQKTENEGIKYEDVLIIYFVTHAKNVLGTLSVICSKGKLNFEADVLANLMTLEVPKYLFFDACYSGKVKKAFKEEDFENNGYQFTMTTASDTLAKFKEEKTVLAAIVADALEAMRGDTTKRKQVDKNADGILSFFELAEYIKEYAAKEFHRQRPDIPAVDISKYLPSTVFLNVSTIFNKDIIYEQRDDIKAALPCEK